jgi:hypothetical protein
VTSCALSDDELRKSADEYDFAIERIAYAGLGAQGFGRWLDQWRQLKSAGWDVTVLTALDGTHAIGLALRRRDE